LQQCRETTPATALLKYNSKGEKKKQALLVTQKAKNSMRSNTKQWELIGVFFFCFLPHV
jgi:hypothetical protein